MPETAVRSKLHVEGVDDHRSLVHLLIRNGITYHPEKFDLSPRELPKVEQLKGIEPLLDGIIPAVKSSTNRIIGFLLDADMPLIDRWRSVADRLRAVGVPHVPDRPPAEGAGARGAAGVMGAEEEEELEGDEHGIATADARRGAGTASHASTAAVLAPTSAPAPAPGRHRQEPHCSCHPSSLRRSKWWWR